MALRSDLTRITPDSLNRAIVDEQIKELRRRLNIDPGEADAHYGLGVAYHNLGLLDDAVRELAEAVRLQPENVSSRLHLAVVLADLAASGRPGAPEAAWWELGHVLRLRPDMPEALLLQARLLTRRRQWDEALAVLARVQLSEAERQRRQAWVFLARADGAQHRRAWREVITSWRSAAECDPDTLREPLGRFLVANAQLALGAAREMGFLPAPRLVVPSGKWFRWVGLAAVAMMLAMLSALAAPSTDAPLVSGLAAGIFVLATWYFIRRAMAAYPVDPTVKQREADLVAKARRLLQGEGLTTAQHLLLAIRVATHLESRDRALDAAWRTSLPVSLPPAAPLPSASGSRAVIKSAWTRLQRRS